MHNSLDFQHPRDASMTGLKGPSQKTVTVNRRVCCREKDTLMEAVGRLREAQSGQEEGVGENNP